MLEDFVFGMGTSVASALTAETIFEIVKCISDVDMHGRGRMGSKFEIFRFLADRIRLRLCYRMSSVCLSVTFCIEAKRCILEQKFLLQRIGSRIHRIIGSRIHRIDLCHSYRPLPLFRGYFRSCRRYGQTEQFH